MHHKEEFEALKLDLINIPKSSKDKDSHWNKCKHFAGCPNKIARIHFILVLSFNVLPADERKFIKNKLFQIVPIL